MSIGGQAVRKTIFLLIVGVVVLLAQIKTTDSITIPNSNIKTVEFFIGQMAGTQLLAGTTTTFSFDFNIPERTPEARYAWIEIDGITLGTTGDSIVRVSLNGKNTNSFMLDGLLETERFTLYYPFYPDITQGKNGPYALQIGAGAAPANPLSAVNAKLVLTYEYDSTSPVQVKTVKYLAAQKNTTLAAATKLLLNFSFFIPESSINITSAFMEIFGVGTNTGATTDFTLGVTLINATTRGPSINPTVDGTDKTQSFILRYNSTLIYPIKASGKYNNFALEVNGSVTGTTTSSWGAMTVLTYEYADSSETQQLKTVRYLVGSGNTSVLSGVLQGYNFVVPVAENMTVQSAWIKYGAWTGAATVGNPTVRLNLTGATKDTNVNYAYAFNLEGSNFVILHNASEIYNMTGNKTEGPFTFNTLISATLSHTNTLDMAELFLTFNYSTSVSKLLTKTIQLAPFNVKPTQAAGPMGADNVFLAMLPENNISVRSAYLETTSVSSSTGVHSLNLSIDGVNQAFAHSSSGPNAYTYILYNLSNGIYNMSSGLNGQYVASVSDTAAASVIGGKVIATYFFH